MSKGGTGGPRPDGAGPVVLIVLDGWGHSTVETGNAIALGSTPVWNGVVHDAPQTLLEASGRVVGLPDGQMGNSEVGHMNLGAGRTVPQDIVRISESIRSGGFYQIPELADLCSKVRDGAGTLHLLGLIGQGGVHAIDEHITGALELARRHRVPRVAIHAFLDGRDTSPTSAADFMRKLVTETQAHSGDETSCFVATATGRYYAMDRDRRWDRTQMAYDAMANGLGAPVDEPVAGILAAYDRGETDEFIKPLVVQRDGQPAARIQSGDAVFCFNFRADRMRQIVRALAIEGFDGFAAEPRPAITIATMTQYDATFPIAAAFAPATLSRTLAELVADAGKSQFRTAETEKYAHVTYFFNAGVEVPFANEERVLVDSQKVATYDLKPEMSAPGVTDVLCRAIEARHHDFILCNYANGDMVGHTGVLGAAVSAVETVDDCLGRVLRSADKARATVMITADHGNCEVMLDSKNGGPHTAHTTNPVPFVLWGERDRTKKLRSGSALCDVGPTVLALLGIDAPSEMTGRDLRED